MTLLLGVLTAQIQLTPLANLQAVGGLADLWAQDTLVFVVAPWGDTPYVHIVSVADPLNPYILSTVTDPRLEDPWDLKAEGNYLYVANQCWGGCADTAGVLIWDISDPANPVLAGKVPLPYGTHNLFVKGGILYTAEEVEIWDVSDPSRPVHLVTLSSVDPALLSYEAHDITVVGETLYVAAGSYPSYGTLRAYRVTDPANPVLVSRSPTLHSGRGSWGHAVWPTENRQYVVQTDEVGEGAVWIWSTQTDPWTLMGSFDYGDAIAHNVQVVGDSLAFVSHYTAGLVVLDIRNPAAPALAAEYDTYPSSNARNYDGAWGVVVRWPYVYVSDMQSGLWIFRVDPVGVVENPREGAPIAPLVMRGRELKLVPTISRAEVRVMDASGRVWWSGVLRGGASALLPPMAPGLYRVWVVSRQGRWTRTVFFAGQ